MKGILIQQKVFKAIDGKYADNVSNEKKLENDEYAYSSIILNLSDSVIRKVGKQNSAKDLWNKLEELYTETSLPSKLFLPEKFFRYKLDLSKNIDENIDDFTKLIQDIKLTGDKNIDDYSPIVLLNAILETYEDVKAAIKYGRDNVNLETVVSGLMSKEMDLKTNKPSQNKNKVLVICLTFESGLKLTLKNVRYVPDLCHNLISCAALEEEGLEGRWGKGIMKIMKGSLTVFKNNDKLEPRAKKCVFIGYPEGVKSPSLTLIENLQKNLCKNFEMKDLGNAKRILGSVMYLMVSTRPDIAYVVSCLSRYMSNAGLPHWEALKWLLRDSRRSTTSYVFTLCGACISWKSQLQNIVALSTTEAEYIATTEAFKESSIQLCKNPVFHDRTKHIDVRYHFIRDIVGKEIINLEKMNSDNNPADMDTFCFGPRQFLAMMKLVSGHLDLVQGGTC
ncbi:Retrovirus-related Pol polyprotein from transposon TNT 1-94 [Sesamum angolense]|uniref:Retrovirus-related Pol polyprotein from transposon TNT 1-94 n=1 Tax=Sesamum angolense TaxID=2727404 RepID=A0AAE1WDR8_9LAMI|nr:Retrovirus-related Pol polyprotein from transposon TNT 1-94 [Sesamum angolense]